MRCSPLVPFPAMNKREFYKRISGLFKPERVQRSRVAVIGLGSGGGRVAAELGRLGARLLLIERPGELLEEHNIVRHLLGYAWLGKPKLSGVAAYIRNLNPSAKVTCRGLDVVQQSAAALRLFRRWKPDLIAVCTDNEQSKQAVNRMGLALDVPQVGAGVYDGGIGGEVYWVRPGGACYGCIADHLQLNRHTPELPANVDYNHLDVHELRSTCALNLDIEQIALLQARVILDLLLDDASTSTGLPAEVNLCVFANRLVPGTFARPLHAEFFAVPKRNDCLDCGRSAADIASAADAILQSLRSRGRLDARLVPER